MPTVSNRAIVNIALTQDGTGGTTGTFTCPVAYRTCSHVPVFEGAGISQTTLTPSGTVTSTDDIQLEVCAWATQSIKPGNNGVIDLVGFDQLEVVTDFSYMFYQSVVANPNTSAWKTSHVTDLFLTFARTMLADPDVSNWNVSKVVSFSHMFWNAISANPNTSSWDTVSANRMEVMFQGASSWNRYSDLLGWVVSDVNDMLRMFNGISIPRENYDAILIAWASQSVQPNVNVHFGNSQYTAGGAAEAARNTLLAAGWVITDSGSV